MDNIATLMQKLTLPKWLKPKPPEVHPGSCCISMDANGFSLVYSRQEKGKIELDICETVACSEEEFPLILTEMVKDYRLQNTLCTWVLSPDKYHLFSLEELPVAASEFQSAIRWNLKKLLPFPVEDAVIDSFSVPPLKIANAKKIITAVVAQLSYLQPLVNIINNSGLSVQNITIPEFGFSHINSLFENDEMSTALIQLKEKSSTLVISKQKEFYLARRLDWGLSLLTKEDNKEVMNSQLDKLALEIQRTFDYFQSHWRNPAPTRVLIAPVLLIELDITGYLSQRLSISMQNLDLNSILQTRKNLSLAIQSQCLAVIGGSLTAEVTNYAEN